MHFNIVIIGGGLVGKSIASALRNTSLSIALIDAIKTDRPDPRLIALNYGSASFLQQIGAWDQIASLAEPIHEVHVSHRGHFGATRMKAGDIDLPALGYVVRAQKINEALDQHLSMLTELRPAVVKDVKPGKPATILVEHEGIDETITADLVLAADGTHSTVRSLLHFETETIDYQQKAIVAPATLQRSHHNITYERFLEDGALAVLPLHHPEHFECATIWTASSTKIDELMLLDDEAFKETLQKNFGYRVGKFKTLGHRAVFPLHFIYVKHPIKENVVLIGNAAHTIHPVGAQGLNLALYEIAHLTQTLQKNIKEGQPLTHQLAEKLPEIQPKTNLLFSHYINPLFSTDNLAVNTAKQAGMIALDLCTPLKNKLSRAMAMEKVRWL